jgi:hypothetical protein
MKKILSTIILFVTLTGCSATMNEWQVGAKHPGYKAKDVCWICGEQIKFYPKEEYGMSKKLADCNYWIDNTCKMSW